jgi:hypothetical protein
MSTVLGIDIGNRGALSTLSASGSGVGPSHSRRHAVPLVVVPLKFALEIATAAERSKNSAGNYAEVPELGNPNAQFVTKDP